MEPSVMFDGDEENKPTIFMFVFEKSLWNRNGSGSGARPVVLIVDPIIVDPTASEMP